MSQNVDDALGSFAMAIATGAVPPMVLKALIELDVLEIIKKAGPGAHLSPAEIAAELPTTNPEAPSMIDRMLRLLVSYEIFTCSYRSLPGAAGGGGAERVYGLAPVCKFFTKNEEGASLAAFLLLVHDKSHMENWYKLKDAVLEGGYPFMMTYEKPIYKQLGIDPRYSNILNNAMSNHSTIITNKFLETYDGLDQGVSLMVDVGGGIGTSLYKIVSKYPSIKGINFDLPHVIKEAPTYPGVEHVGGNMFASVPSGDAIFLKFILHNYMDDKCLILLKNCHNSLPDQGKVIVCEYTPPNIPQTSDSAKTACNLDGLMLVINHGKERTEEEFEKLAMEAGFEGFRVACVSYDMKVMEFFKKN